jgi:protein transport protein SEC23
VGGTSAWYLGGLDPNTTVAVYFDMQAQTVQDLRGQRQGYIQLMTTYRHSNGTTRLRVTSVAKAFADVMDATGINYIKAGFDQEAAAVTMARYAVHKTQSDSALSIRGWLDRLLIQVCKKFATYSPQQPQSFRLSPQFSYYPQFMFHLRRSQFLQVFNCSPDETAFFRIILSRENVANSIVMIQPSLVQYSLEGAARPVVLDMASAQPNCILFLDTFFHVVIWYGDNIHKWQQQGVHLQEAYAYFAQLLKAPKNDAQKIMKSRFPFPMLVECVQGGSQERFLLSKLNPAPPPSDPHAASTGTQHFSEDATFKVFMDHLRRLTTQAN